MLTKKNPLRPTVFYVQGMHCASCEILIEKKLSKDELIKSATVSLARGIATITPKSGEIITADHLNQLFGDDGYCFSKNPFKKSRVVTDNSSCAVPQSSNPLSPLFIAGLVIVGFLLLDKTGLTSLVSVDGASSLPIFLIFGLLAGFSSCAALVGGIILSLSKQWVGNYGKGDSLQTKLEPLFLFNGGRVLGYAFFGTLLGIAGNYFQLSPFFTAGLVIAVSLMMILLGLQMLGVRALANFQIRLPKSLTGGIADESNFKGRLAPILMGALTFFLPCGFTVTAQALALTSGSPVTGALIMGLFALGTIPGLLAIGYSSVKFHSNPKTSRQFSAIAGYLVLFFALYNINNQLVVMGLPNITSVLAISNTTTQAVNQTTLAPISNGKQIITMLATSGEYRPNQFTVKVGVPVSWQITNDGTAGCGSSIVARGLFSDRIDTVPNQTVTKEFTPTKPGTYRFSCTMGMYTGTITVVDANGSSGLPDVAPAESGAKGCGCGGGSVSGGSCH